MLIVGWLAITAPLSKSLEPIAPPELTLLASDGTPIARTGAIVERPVEVAKLPRHVTGAFLAIEDRRFSATGASTRAASRARCGPISPRAVSRAAARSDRKSPRLNSRH